MDSLPVSSGERPIPVPRTRSPAPKKPVPLPRTLADHDTSKPSDSDHLPSHSHEQVNYPSKSVTRSLKKELKSATETVQERGKAVMEGTRNASARLEKTVRSMIDKRRTGYQISPVKDKEPTITRSNSLPAQDIFQSISFHSPLSDDQLNEIKSPPSICELEDSSDEESDTLNAAPPPVYPPPPLPDESVYDELQSVISSHSSNDPYCSSVSGSYNDSESLYEDISMTRGQVNQSPTSQTSLSRAELERCESWSFYDAAAKEAEEASMVVPAHENNCELNKDSSNIYYDDPTSAAFSRTISFASDSPLVLEEFDLEALQQVISNCDVDLSRRDGSESRLSSISVENDLYNQWDPMKHFLPLAQLRIKDGEPKTHHSQSVMFEFDPLYSENKDIPENFGSLGLKEMSLAQSLSPYGKINKIAKINDDEGTSENKEDSIGPLPIVPPRSYNSTDLSLTQEATSTVPKVSDASELEVRTPSPGSSSQKPKPVNHNTETILPQKSNSQTSLNILELPPKTPKRPVETPPVKAEAPAKPKRAMPITKTLAQTPSSSRPKHTLFTNPISRKEDSLTVPEPPPTRATSVPKEDTPAKSHTSLVRWSSMKKAFRQVADGSRRFAVKPEAGSDLPKVERPGMTSQMSSHSGVLYRAAASEWGKDFAPRYCVLAEGRLTCYADKSRTEIRDVIPLNSILSVQLVLDHKTTTEGDLLHCLELNVSWKGRSYIFGSTGSTERRVWMQKILESLTMDFPMRISSDYSRSGWCYMKEGISGAWGPAWILLSKRTFFYKLQGRSVQEIDLRKARCVELQDCGPNSPKVEDNGQAILLDYPGQSVYLKMDLAKETVAWRNAVKAASIDNGSNLAQQQLTKEDVPAIVDKCINFVYAHGSLSEGIYRRSGANSSVAKLLAQFRHDAWSVQLTRQEYNEFDVASVLKRFFRDLPESLLTTELHSELCEISAGTGASDKLNFYRKSLEKLPPINYLTLRRLLGHLYFIQGQQEKTLMPIDNLASIWGPTLMHVEGVDTLNVSRVQSVVVADLILFYPSLFDVDEDERRRERRMQDALERLHAAGNNNILPKKPSGDLKVWVHVGARDSKNCVNVSIGPQRLAGEVCAELSARLPAPAHELCLEEVVLGGSLVRPLHHTERVLEAILRWGYWDDADRKDNCLVLRKNTVVAEIASHAKQPASASGELRYADLRSKSFKSYLFEFSQAKLCYYKDKNCSTKIKEWKIEDIVWYIGHEPKRNPQTRWSITFIEKTGTTTRSKENPFFGHTIAGTSSEELSRWMAAMFIGEYQQDLMMQPVLLH